MAKRRITSVRDEPRKVNGVGLTARRVGYSDGSTVEGSPASVTAGLRAGSEGGVSALKDYGDQDYDGQVAGMSGFTNREAQDARVGLAKRGMVKRHQAKAKAEEARELERAEERRKEGTMTVADAKRLGLLGGRSRYSSEFAGGSADALVGGQNQTRIMQNEAALNRASAEKMAESRGIMRGRGKPVTVSSNSTLVDPVNGLPINRNISPADARRKAQLEQWNNWHAGEKKGGMFKYTDESGYEREMTHQAALAQNEAELDALNRKYSGGGKEMQGSEDLIAAIPELAADPETLAQALQLMKERGMTIEEIKANLK